MSCVIADGNCLVHPAGRSPSGGGVAYGHEPMVFAGRLFCSRTGFPNVRFWFASRQCSSVPSLDTRPTRGDPGRARSFGCVRCHVSSQPSDSMLAADEFALLPAFFVLIGIILE